MESPQSIDLGYGRILQNLREKAMIECKELTNKVIAVFAIYEDGQYGPEVHIEFTDGTTFSACLQNQVSIEAKHIAKHGDQFRILKDYSSPAVPR